MAGSYILLRSALLFRAQTTHQRAESEDAGMHLRTVAMAALLIGFQCFAGCNASAGETDNQTPALWPTKSWQVSTPEEQGMDSASLARLIETVGTYRQDSLMIIRHGKI